MNTRFQTLGAAAFALIAVTVSGTTVHNVLSPEEVALIPTIEGYSLLGQVGPSQSLTIHEYSPEMAAEGVTLYADAHNFFSCRTGGITSFTVPSVSAAVRFWGYEFTGNEPPFNGSFYVSEKEIMENPNLNNLPQLDNMSELKRYYVMTESDLSLTCGRPISTTVSCGDNICQQDETADSCIQDCNTCGDGIVYGDEECDSNSDSPGCSDSCTVEVGYTCGGEPSQCDLLIPNLPGEEEEEDVISLKGVKITENNDVVVQYSKNFETCAHIYREGIGQFDQHINFICAAGTDIESTANQSEFNDVLSVGDRVKICHGNNNKICSEYVTVTGKKQSTTGSLFITQDSTPTPSHQLLGGTLGEPILRLTFYAEGEDIDVTDIQLPTHATVQSIDRLELYRDGEAQKFAEATKGGCGTDPKPDGTTFCVNMESQQLVIPSGKDIDVIFRPRMKTDNQGGISGEDFNISVDRTAMSVQARGVTSSNNLVVNNADNTANGEIFIGTDAPRSNSSITGNISQSVLAKITSITNANPDANGTNVPVGVSPIGQFKFAAAKHTNSKNGDNDAVLDAIRFDVNGTNVAVNATSFKLYNKADPSSSIACSPYYMTGELFTSANISGVYTVLCKNIANSLVDSEIDEGESITLVLETEIISPNIAGPRDGGSTLEVSLTNFNHFTNENSNIKWIDTDQVTQQRFNWIEYPETKVSSTLYNS